MIHTRKRGGPHVWLFQAAGEGQPHVQSPGVLRCGFKRAVAYCAGKPFLRVGYRGSQPSPPSRNIFMFCWLYFKSCCITSTHHTQEGRADISGFSSRLLGKEIALPVPEGETLWLGAHGVVWSMAVMVLQHVGYCGSRPSMSSLEDHFLLVVSHRHDVHRNGRHLGVFRDRWARDPAFLKPCNEVLF